MLQLNEICQKNSCDGLENYPVNLTTLVSELAMWQQSNDQFKKLMNNEQVTKQMMK